MIVLLSLAAAQAPLDCDRSWEVLEPAEPRAMLRQAGEKLGDWPIELAGVPLDGPTLVALADSAPDEPFLRVLREELRRAVDLEDLLYFLDDVLVAEERRGERFVVGSGRARSAGILVHPDEVYKNKPRHYGRSATLAVDQPETPQSVEPAADGEPLGPGWSARYPNPTERADLLAAIVAERPDSTFAQRLESLMVQLELQGAELWLTSTVRSRARGYLMWGAFALSRSETDAALQATLTKVEANNAAWGLNVPILWQHPEGLDATLEAARQMAEAYDVVFANESSARYSNHYGGKSADLVVVGLPRTLSLSAPDGASTSFDLSDPEESRDLSLSPQVVKWVERHFGFEKLRSDYPHWTDTR